MILFTNALLGGPQVPDPTNSNPRMFLAEMKFSFRITTSLFEFFFIAFQRIKLAILFLKREKFFHQFFYKALETVT